MDHHRHVDIVEMAFGEQLRLAEQEFDLTPLLALETLLDVDELLGGNGEKDEFARQLLGGLGIAKPDRGTQHPGDLRVVAAAMRRPGVPDRRAGAPRCAGCRARR